MGFPLWLRTLRQAVPNQPVIVRGPYVGGTRAKVPKGEHLLAMMDVIARTGARGEEYVEDNVLGAYGRDALNGNVFENADVTSKVNRPMLLANLRFRRYSLPP